MKIVKNLIIKHTDAYSDMSWKHFPELKDKSFSNPEPGSISVVWIKFCSHNYGIRFQKVKIIIFNSLYINAELHL